MEAGAEVRRPNTWGDENAQNSPGHGACTRMCVSPREKGAVKSLVQSASRVRHRVDPAGAPSSTTLSLPSSGLKQCGIDSVSGVANARVSSPASACPMST